MNETFTIIAAVAIVLVLVRYNMSSRRKTARVNKFMENMNNYDKKK